MIASRLKPIRLGYSQPSPETISAITEAVTYGEIGQGRAVSAFEEAFAGFMGRKYAVACSSGTSALTVALAAIRKGNNFNVATLRADSFVAVPNAAWAAGFRRFVCHEPETIGTGLAHIAVDVMGDPEPLTHRTILEDFSEALGSVDVTGRKCGSRGTLCGITSFFVTHTITAGEGGAIVTDDEGFLDECRALRDHGRWGMEPNRRPAYPGFNAKMTTIEALLAMDSLQHITEKLEARRRNALTLDRLMGREWTQPGVIPHGYPIFSAQSTGERDFRIRALADAGIEARPYFQCLPTQTWVKEHLFGPEQAWPISELRGWVGYYLPIHEGVTRDDCQRMVDIVQRPYEYEMGL